MVDEKKVKENIYSTFSDIASFLGFSPIHGRIIAVLLIKNKTLSLTELANETGYSASMISLSLDMLEVMGIINKIKKAGDRNLYVSLQGDLIESLKNALTMRLKNSIDISLGDLKKYRKSVKNRELKKSLIKLESQISRLNKYISLLSKVRLP